MSRQAQSSSDKSIEFIKFECPSCGATLDLDPFNPVVKCNYCGCNFLKTDEVSKKVLLDALEIKKLEQKLVSAIETNSWDIQYQCYKTLAMATDNELYTKHFRFWEVLLGHNDITKEFLSSYSLDELKGFMTLMDKLPATCSLQGTPLAVLAVKTAFSRIIKTCESSEYSVSDAVALEYSKNLLYIKPTVKSKFPTRLVSLITVGIAIALMIYLNGINKTTFVISLILLGAAFIVSALLDKLGNAFNDTEYLISYNIRFPNGILTTGLSPLGVFNAQPQIDDTILNVYQDGLDILYKRTVVKEGKLSSVQESIFLPYINLASVRILGANGLSVKQRYTDLAYAFEVSDLAATEVQVLVAYVMARMKHYQIGHM